MKFNSKRTVLIGLAFMSILAFWQFYDQIIPIILEEHYHQSTFITNCIMAIDNILAIFMLPLFGNISDKTKTRYGKRTPYIFCGTIGAVICMGVLAAITNHAGFIPFVSVLLILLIIMSIYRSPAVAYMPDVTPKPLRSKGNAIVNLVGYIGGIFSTVAIMFLVKRDPVTSQYKSFVPIFMTIGAFMLITVLIMVIFVNENKVVEETRDEVKKYENAEETVSKTEVGRDVKKSLVFMLLSVALWYMAYNAVTTSFSRYFDNKFGVDAGGSSLYMTVATIVAIISFVPIGAVSSKFGRKITILLGVMLMAVNYLIAYFISPGIIMYIVFGLVGVGWAAINVNSLPMVVDMCKETQVGSFTGYYYAFSMAGQIITPILSGAVITKFGYSSMFPYAVIFSVLALITMLFVKHGDSKPETKKSLLENFNVED